MKFTTTLVILAILAVSTTALELPIGVQKIVAYQQQIALSLTFLIVFIGGIITFTSPCGFVVLPTFFSYVFKERKRAIFMTALFSLGMILAFTIFGIIAGLLGNFFNHYKEFFAAISGILFVLFGSLLILNKGFSLFDFRIKHQPNHSWDAFFLGFFFAVGWTPCVGPILGGVVLLAAGTGHMLKSIALFSTYALGVATPLMLISYYADKYDLSPIFTSKHVELTLFGKKVYTHLYGIIGGTTLIIIGLIMFFGKGTSFFMDTIPNYLPWTMNTFTAINEYLVESPLFTHQFTNLIGIIIAIAAALIILKSIRYHKSNKPNTKQQEK